eukprot:4620457-Amphidinium_carterae.2
MRRSRLVKNTLTPIQLPPPYEGWGNDLALLQPCCFSRLREVWTDRVCLPAAVPSMCDGVRPRYSPPKG